MSSTFQRRGGVGLVGARVVKTLNQLPARLLASDPVEHGGRRVMFLAGDDGRAVGAVSKLVGDLGFAPIALGTLAGVGTLLDKGGALVLQNLVKQWQERSRADVRAAEVTGPLHESRHTTVDDSHKVY